MRQAADGSCTGAPVDLTAGTMYWIAENDFMSTGGDGYPNFYTAGRVFTLDYMDEGLADHITANSVGFYQGSAPTHEGVRNS